MPANNDPVVLVPPVQPCHKEGEPLNLNFKMVFAPCNVRGLTDHKGKVPRDGKWHRMSVLNGKKGKTTKDYDKMLYFNWGDLLYDCVEEKLAEESYDDLLVYIHEALLVFLNQVQESYSNGLEKDADAANTSHPAGKVKIALASYSPLHEASIVMNHIFDGNLLSDVQEYQELCGQAYANIKPILDPLKDKGWEFEVEYIAFLDIVGIRRETKEEENERLRREEELMVKQLEEYERKVAEEQRRQAEAKRRAEELNRAKMIISGIGLIVSVAFVAVGVAVTTVACPPAGIAMGAAIAGTIAGSGFFVAGAVIHAEQMKWEKEYTGEINWGSHVVGLGLDLAAILPWGAIASRATSSTQLINIIDKVGTGGSLFYGGYGTSSSVMDVYNGFDASTLDNSMTSHE